MSQDPSHTAAARSHPIREIRTVGVCLKIHASDGAGEPVRGLVKWLEERRLGVRLDEGAAECVGRPGTDREALVAKVDLVVVLGGDGTLLSVARAAGPLSVPILGVNLGRLGFLTEIALDELFAALDRVLAGNARVEERMRLDVSAERDGRPLGSFLAFNDAVLNSLSFARMIDLEVFADGIAVTTYHADGLILATPTGSTAYSLSAGGPILDPSLAAIVMTPICPHTLTQRPLVLPESSRIEIEVHPRGGSVQLTADGQEGVALEEGDRVKVSRSEHAVRLVVSPFRSRYEILRTKLHWGAR